jgi:hypothetical protein
VAPAGLVTGPCWWAAAPWPISLFFCVFFFFYFLFSACDLYLDFKSVLDDFEFKNSLKIHYTQIIVHCMVLIISVCVLAHGTT